MKPDSTSQKIEEIRTMTGLKSSLPDIPVAVAVQEAFRSLIKPLPVDK